MDLPFPASLARCDALFEFLLGLLDQRQPEVDALLGAAAGSCTSLTGNGLGGGWLKVRRQKLQKKGICINIF